jgi:hypothetical protein
MVKDLFGRHCPVRSAGSEIRKRATDDVSFFLKYKRSECADFYVAFDFGESYFTLFGFRLSFCVACGRFVRFGTSYEICWVCESELE